MNPLAPTVYEVAYASLIAVGIASLLGTWLLTRDRGLKMGSTYLTCLALLVLVPYVGTVPSVTLLITAMRRRKAPVSEN